MYSLLIGGMRLAFIFQWHFGMQRPHHWVVQAVARGHEADVYTPAKAPWDRCHVRYDYASRIISTSNRTLERLLRRSLASDSSIVQRLKLRSDNREQGLWERLWNGDGGRPYDAVVFSGSVPRLVARKRRSIPLVYDCMDQWDGFPNSDPNALVYEDSLVAASDMVVAVTDELTRRLGARHGYDKCRLLPNGCNYRHFSVPARRVYPRGWTEDRPIIGYAGQISEWFDWDLVAAVARTSPNALIWLIGHCSAPPPCSLPTNIVLEGFVPYEELPARYASFDLSIIPFKGKKLLQGVSPIKLYEYLAAGKLVVATSMPDAVRLRAPGVVEVADEPTSFAQACARALYVKDPMLESRRREIAQANSWEARWLQLETSIYDAKHGLRRLNHE